MQRKLGKIQCADLLNVLLPVGIFLVLFWADNTAPRASILAASAELQTATQKPVAIVRFELYHNRIFVPVEINGSSAPAIVVIDTGASMSALSDVEAAALGIEIRDKGDIKNAGNGEESIHYSQAKNVRFRLGEVDVLAKTAGVVPLRSWERFEGRSVAGILGADLFKKYVVEVDYDGQSLALFEPDSFVVPPQAETLPLALLGGLIPAIETTLEFSKQCSLHARLVVDMGTYSALRLNRPFIEEHKLLACAPKLVPSLGFGLEGDFRAALGRLQSLRIGALSLDNVLTSFSQSTSGQTTTKAYDGSIGGELLRQFRVTLDYSRKRIILQPGRNFQKIGQADMSGAVLVASVPDFGNISVYRVFEGTPAAESGLREGDVLLAIDNIPAPGLGLDKIRELFDTEGNYDLRVRRADRELHLKLSTRKLI